MSTRYPMRFMTPRPQTADVVAGASVALVLIPQAMAYAELAGLPPQVGLFASALPLIFAAPFVSSAFLQTGPVALTGLLTLGALEGRAVPFTEQYVELAVLLALMVGVFRLALGVLRLGNLAYLLSNPVLAGFTTGAAVLIVASQIPRAVGVGADGDGVLLDAISTIGAPQEWEPAAVLFVVVTGALMVLGRRLYPLFPGVLLVVVGSIVISRVTNYGGATIGELPGGFIKLHLEFPWGSAVSLLPAAFALALVGFAEPSSIARSFAAQDRTPWDANQEMVSQGVANITSAFSGGLPVGGSFSRSSIGRLAGAKTRWSGAFTGLFVLIALPFAALAEPLPRAVLAAIVMTSVVKLINLRAIVRLFNESWPQGVVGLGTLIATLAFAPRVERGVFVGVGLAIAVHLIRELNIAAEHTVAGSTLTVLPQGVLWFATVPQIERMVRRNLAENDEIKTVRVNMAGVGRLDYTGAATLKQVAETLVAAGTTVEISNVPPGARRAVAVHLSQFATGGNA